jgi:hypothetical protein
LLGLFAFGLLTKRKVSGWAVPVIAVICPALSYFITSYAPIWFDGFRIGIEVLILNGALMFAGLWAISKPEMMNSLRPAN